MPISVPTPNVTAAAAAPIRTWRTPLNTRPRPVSRLTAAPIANSAANESPSAPIRAGTPVVSRKGISGTIAPIEKATNEDAAAPHGEPSSSGSSPELLAHLGVERLLRILHQARRDLARILLRESLGAVDVGQLLFLDIGHDAQLFALDRDLVLEQLALALHADVLAGAHRERTGHETGDAGEHDQMVVGGRPGDAHHERQVAHQAVVGAEDGGAQRARSPTAMPCLLANVAPGRRLELLPSRKPGPDCGMLALVGRDPGRLGRQLRRVCLLFVALESENHVGHAPSAETPSDKDDHPDACPRTIERRHFCAGLLEARGPDLGVPALVGSDPLERGGTMRFLLDLCQLVVQDDRVALELQVCQASSALVRGQRQCRLGHWLEGSDAAELLPTAERHVTHVTDRPTLLTRWTPRHCATCPRPTLSGALPSVEERVELASRALVALANDGAEMPSKIGVHPRPGALLHAMPAWLRDGDLVGLKWVAAFPDNRSHDLPAINGLVVLNDAETGLPTWIMDASRITAVRTAAVSGVALRLLQPAVVERVAILGAGIQARSHIEVVRALLPDAVLVLYDRHPERAEALAEEVRGGGGSVDVVEDARSAAGSAQVVVTVATLGASSQVMGPDWVAPGTLVVAVDFATYVSAELARVAGTFLVDDLAQFLAYRDAGYFDGYPEPTGTMGEALERPRLGSESTDARTAGVDVVSHLGVGLADVILADAIARRADAAGLGVELAR